MPEKPLLAITLGDPAGVGPRVAADAARHPRVRRLCRPVLVGDARVLRPFRVRPPVRTLSRVEEAAGGPGVLNVLHIPHPGTESLRLGRPQKAAGESAVMAVRAAARLAQEKRVVAVVTGPVSKESLALAGVPFPGHTELLADISGTPRVEMLMAAGPLMALLLTRHIPLKDVPHSLAPGAIAASIRLADAWLRKFRGRRPRWAVCGLNPHAGDNGLLGREEKRVVAPAVRRLTRAGVLAEGPLPADAAWAKHAAGRYDAVACLYHDQGMIPLKTLHPRGVVNITAGLPWIRTSPGHGTAYDLASSRPPYARADPSATIEAALWALKLAGIGDRG